MGRVDAGRLVRELPGILAPFFLAIAVVALALRVLNLVPVYWVSITSPPPPVQPVLNERLEYPSLEAAEKDLGVTIATPTYFPSYLEWPAASIRGQRDPARVVSLLFQSTGERQLLQIREIFWPGEALPFPVPEPMMVLSRDEVEINGSRGQLLLGQGQGEAPVNQLRWRDGGVHFVVTAALSPQELLRICRSIHLAPIGHPSE